MTDSAGSRDSRDMATHTLSRPAFASAFREESSAFAVPSVADVYAAHFKYVWRCLRSLGVPDAALDDESARLAEMLRAAAKRIDTAENKHEHGCVDSTRNRHRRSLWFSH